MSAPQKTTTVEKLRSATESNIAVVFSWLLPKVGWMILIWVVWSAKTYLNDYIESTPSFVLTKETLSSVSKRVDASEALIAKQTEELKRLSERQDKSETAFNNSLLIQQSMLTSIAVQTTRVETNERRLNRLDKLN